MFADSQSAGARRESVPPRADVGRADVARSNNRPSEFKAAGAQLFRYFVQAALDAGFTGVWYSRFAIGDTEQALDLAPRRRRLTPTGVCRRWSTRRFRPPETGLRL